MMDLEKIQTKDFCCLDGFVGSFVDKLFDFDDEFTSVSVIANEDMIQEIFRRIMSMTGTCEDLDATEVPIFEMKAISFNNECYDKEYILTIDNDFGVFLEPMWRNNQYGVGYLNAESNAVYVYETANWDVLNHVDADEVFIFGFED
ncbi:MAG: hypothetical protein WCR36_10035 [Bacteroidaceae bacterium]